MSDNQYIERYWRDDIPQDSVKFPTMKAQFRNYKEADWILGSLAGFVISEGKYSWFDENGNNWIYCQVYDSQEEKKYEADTWENFYFGCYSNER